MTPTKTFFDFTALFLAVEASVFLIRPNLGLTANTIVQISKTYYGYNMGVARSLSDQSIDTRMGLFILLSSLVIQTYGLSTASTLAELEFNLGSFKLSASVCGVVFIIALVISHLWKKALYKKIETTLKTRHDDA